MPYDSTLGYAYVDEPETDGRAAVHHRCDPNLDTLTLDTRELFVLQLALRNWDGWDDVMKQTISDDLEAVRDTLKARIETLTEPF